MQHVSWRNFKNSFLPSFPAAIHFGTRYHYKNTVAREHVKAVKITKTIAIMGQSGDLRRWSDGYAEERYES